MEKLYLVIPAYNELKNIETCVKDWHEVVEKRVKKIYRIKTCNHLRWI